MDSHSNVILNKLTYFDLERELVNVFLDDFGLDRDFRCFLDDRRSTVPGDLGFRLCTTLALHSDKSTALVRNDAWLLDKRRREASRVFCILENYPQLDKLTRSFR